MKLAVIIILLFLKVFILILPVYSLEIKEKKKIHTARLSGTWFSVAFPEKQFISEGYRHCWLRYAGMPSPTVFSLISGIGNDSANIYIPITSKVVKTDCMVIELLEIDPMYIKF